MIYVVNYDMDEEDISKISDFKYNNIFINCLDHSTKGIENVLINTFAEPNRNFFSGKICRYIIRNVYFANNKSIDIVFRNVGRIIYLINISYEQEKYIYSKHKNKYRYYKCSFKRRDDSFTLMVKRVMFWNDMNKLSLLEGQSYDIGYLLKLISYNLPESVLSETDFLNNLELIMDLGKYVNMINKENIFVSLLLNFVTPSYITKFRYPPKHRKGKKKKEESELKTKYGGNIEDMARDKMIEYFKYRDSDFGNINTSKKAKKNNDNTMSLI